MTKFLQLLAVTGLGMGLILCLAYIAHAQEPKPPKIDQGAIGPQIPEARRAEGLPVSESKQLSEVQKLRLMVAYQKAVMAQAQMQQAVNDFNFQAETERKASGFPEGTRFDVKPEQNQVFVITPPTPENPAEPAVKK